MAEAGSSDLELVLPEALGTGFAGRTFQDRCCIGRPAGRRLGFVDDLEVDLMVVVGTGSVDRTYLDRCCTGFLVGRMFEAAVVRIEAAGRIGLVGGCGLHVVAEAGCMGLEHRTGLVVDLDLRAVAGRTAVGLEGGTAHFEARSRREYCCVSQAVDKKSVVRCRRMRRHSTGCANSHTDCRSCLACCGRLRSCSPLTPAGLGHRCCCCEIRSVDRIAFRREKKRILPRTKTPAHLDQNSAVRCSSRHDYRCCCSLRGTATPIHQAQKTACPTNSACRLERS